MPPRSRPFLSIAGSVRNRRLGGGRVDGDAAQKIVGGVERLVVLLVRRNVGLRSRLLGALGGKVAAHRGLTLGIDAALQLIRNILQHLDVGREVAPKRAARSQVLK